MQRHVRVALHSAHWVSTLILMKLGEDLELEEERSLEDAKG